MRARLEGKPDRYGILRILVPISSRFAAPGRYSWPAPDIFMLAHSGSFSLRGNPVSYQLLVHGWPTHMLWHCCCWQVKCRNGVSCGVVTKGELDTSASYTGHWVLNFPDRLHNLFLVLYERGSVCFVFWFRSVHIHDYLGIFYTRVSAPPVRQRPSMPVQEVHQHYGMVQ